MNLNLDQVLSLAVLGDMVYYLLVFGMNLVMMMMESFVISVLSRSHWIWQKALFSGLTVICVVCGYIPTVLLTRMQFLESLNARNVHLNLFSS